MSLFGTDGLVSRAVKPMLDIGYGGNLVDWITHYQQKFNLFVVSSMLAPGWIEENIAKYLESKATTGERIHAIDYSRRFELFETACKVFAVAMKVRHVWSRIQFFSWFRDTLTSWLYTSTKNYMKKHQK